VLYSLKDSAWKLADFGFASEANSQSVQISSKGRGTPCYRAPEFFADYKPGFTNKVDIWSMGCILYELAVGRRAFENDYAILEYRLSRKPPVVLLDDCFSSDEKDTIKKNIAVMLQVDPSLRPSALQQFKFTSYHFYNTGSETDKIHEADDNIYELSFNGDSSLKVKFNFRKVGRNPKH
jgi:serine/threonine protein kinase